MIRSLLLLALFILISSCDCSSDIKEVPGSRRLRRYENSEVICYIFTSSYKGGLSCKWKEVK